MSRSIPDCGIAFIADPAGMNRLEHFEQRCLGGCRPEKNDVRILGGADVTVKIDGVAADDDEGHTSTREGGQEFNRSRRIRRRHECVVSAGCAAKTGGGLRERRPAKRRPVSGVQQIAPCGRPGKALSCRAVKAYDLAACWS